MDFQLDQKHQMARDLFKDFAEKEVKPLAIEVDETEVFPRDTVTKMQKKPPVKANEMEMELVKTLKERDRRHFIACKAMGPDGGSIRAVCKAFKCSPNTVSKAIFEF